MPTPRTSRSARLAHDDRVKSDHVVYLADHSVLLAIPAFVPALAVAGVVVYIAMRDRRTPDPDAPVKEEDS